MDVKEQVFAILETITESNDFRDNLDLDLFASGLMDSLGAVEMLLKFNEVFDVAVSPAEFEREEWATANKIIANLTERMS